MDCYAFVYALKFLTNIDNSVMINTFTIKPFYNI